MHIVVKKAQIILNYHKILDVGIAKWNDTREMMISAVVNRKNREAKNRNPLSIL